MVKSEWLPTMPLHVAIWSQIVMEAELSWADQGKTIRLLANAWSSGELIRKPWASDDAWRSAERMWPEMLAERTKNLRTKDTNSARAKAAAEARWKDNPPAPVDARSNAQSMLQACVEHPPSNARSREQEQEHKQEEKNPCSPRAGDETFEVFWREYPKHRRVKKPKARQAWKRHVGLAEVPTVMLALARDKLDHEWQRDGGQYVPHPTTWLNQHRWEDEDEPQDVASPYAGTKEWLTCSRCQHDYARVIGQPDEHECAVAV